MPEPSSALYLIRKVNTDFRITGLGATPAWNGAALLSDFCYPWEDDVPRNTVFRAVHGPEWIYFRFEVDDAHVHVETVNNDKSEVIDSSRVEIFFRRDEQLSPYYCLEVDATGRVLDYTGHFHRQFDFQWSWPSGALQVSALPYEGGYHVEMAISKASLKKLGLLDEESSQLQAGLFRAQCTHTVVARDHMRWISWIKPDAPLPDFHIPSAFGVLRLER